MVNIQFSPEVSRHEERLAGPTVSILNNRIKRNFNPTLLKVEYKALNPVTIKWYVDGVKVGEAMDRVRSSSTSLRLSTEWLSRHPQSRYKVSVFDQQLGRVEGANPVTRSCRVKVVLGDLSNYNLCVKGCRCRRSSRVQGLFSGHVFWIYKKTTTSTRDIVSQRNRDTNSHRAHLNLQLKFHGPLTHL
ncbi:uncharacterized protein LOC117298925 [Asterias rubens]|uniref:uncharacterized protein LOC117298925 n=1 Tax=Asterias rubens TaxID=7604 RepID=UPI001455293B|nr:uncharacterized protein LOC117298925 [Asterias rubens]